MKVHLQEVADAGHWAYRPLDDNGVSTRLGLFVSKRAAVIYCGRRGWRVEDLERQDAEAAGE